MADRIRDVLERKSPEVWTVHASDRVGDAAELMLEKAIGSVVVVEGKRVLGVLDERDVVVQVTVDGHQPWKKRAGDLVAERPLVTAHPEQTVHEVIEIMTERRRRHLPVCAGDTLVGVISLGDLGKWLSEAGVPDDFDFDDPAEADGGFAS